jgi:hypothetical protein
VPKGVYRSSNPFPHVPKGVLRNSNPFPHVPKGGFKEFEPLSLRVETVLREFYAGADL